MSSQVRLLIHKKKSVYNYAVISSKSIYQYEKFKDVEQHENQNITTVCDCEEQRRKFLAIPLRKKGINSYLVSVYVHTMNRSDIYRRFAVNKLVHFINLKLAEVNINPVILITLRTPCCQFIDYAWNEKMSRMAMERQEIDHAMSWLSTLGGAFSALGDQFDYCAKVAGKISLEQFKLSMRLGDPQLVARCELYAALSLLQQGRFKIAELLIRKIYKFAINDKDIRLQRMCQGVWAKLKYCYNIRNQRVQPCTC